MNRDSSSYTVRKRMDESSIWEEGSPELGVLDIELTERCNLNCIHCYINQPAGDKEILARDVSRRLRWLARAALLIS